MKTAPLRHARGGGHPGFLMVLWIPAFAGMTAGGRERIYAQLCLIS
jgi:hypothetical protein